jgi:hypothetical protein
MKVAEVVKLLEADAGSRHCRVAAGQHIDDLAGCSVEVA